METPAYSLHDSGRPALYALGRMTWPEFENALPDLEWALVPVGAAQEHGSTGSFGVDSLRAEEFCLAAAERLYPKAISLPPVRYGVHLRPQGRRGGLGLRPETFMAWCKAICGSLYHHGLRKMVFLSANDASLAALGIVCNQFRRDRPDTKLAWASLDQLARPAGEPRAGGGGAVPPGTGISERPAGGPELEDEIAQYRWLTGQVPPLSQRTAAARGGEDDRGAMMIEAALERLLRFLEGW